MLLTNNNLSDEELILKLKEDDETALVKLYEKYWKPLFVVGGNILHNEQDVEECIQNVFVSLWNRRKELVITKGIEHYLSVSIKYQALACLLKERRRRRLANDQPHDLADINTPELHFLTQELAERISRSINKLPPTCKLIFQLQKDEGLSIQDIADKLEISKNTVKMHLKIANKRLRNDLLTYLPFILYYIIFLKK